MWVKICGVRDEWTAEQICRLSPDAIGLNFYAKSVRAVSPDVAVRIASLVGDCVQRVGVFVNHSVAEIEDLVRRCRLSAVQLHGDETPVMVAEVAARLPEIPLYRAWRIDGESLRELENHLAECQARGCVPAGCLVDANAPGEYGGTGRTVPWDTVVRLYQPEWPPLILAGGLNPDNVAGAIRVVHPWGVDVASGVESAPGVKDLQKVQRFIENARSGQAR